MKLVIALLLLSGCGHFRKKTVHIKNQPCEVVEVVGGVLVSCPESEPILIRHGTQGEKGEKGDQGVDGKDGSTGATGAAGLDGVDGVDGAVGPSGYGPSMFSISVELNRQLLPWADNNKEVVGVPFIIGVPGSFTVQEISTTGSGWIDIVTDKQVLCFQKAVSTKRFDFSYKKLDGALTGCDTNDDKDLSFSFLGIIEGEEFFQMIPRDPRLQDIVPVFNFWGVK
jgi:hypothetical protein